MSVKRVSATSLLRLTTALFCAIASDLVAGAEPEFAGPVVAGSLGAPPNNEASGLAASRRTPNLLWTHDDSGGAAVLYAVGTDGTLRGRLQLKGVQQNDWEDLATTELDGRPWIVVGDIGDNEARRKHVSLHFVAEPTAAALAAGGQLAERPAFTLKITYEDGPRDCEAIAVDGTERAIYFLTKRNAPPRLYRVALPSPLAGGEFMAKLVGTTPHLAKVSASQGFFGNFLSQRLAMPCAMDFAPDGSAAVVVTYGETLLFPRRAGESWAAALAREPVRLAPHGLPQAEAACFSRDGAAIFVASEETRQLLRYDRR